MIYCDSVSFIIVLGKQNKVELGGVCSQKNQTKTKKQKTQPKPKIINQSPI